MSVFSLMIVIVLASLIDQSSSGEAAVGWSKHDGKYLGSYSAGVAKYDTLEQAQAECIKRTDCGGITYETRGSRKYTLRRGADLRDSRSAEISWKVSESGKKWRTDLRCGKDYPLPDGTPAQCNPNHPDGRGCCSRYGYCGFSASHCTCSGCKDYRACPKCSNLNSDLYERTGMEYHVADAKVQQLRPTAVGHKTIRNKGSRDQSVGMSISETVSESMSFSHTAGASVSVGTEFSCGVPLIASGSVSVEVSVSYEFSYGTETTVEKTINADFTCIGPPGKKTICEAVLIKDRITVPYTMTWTLKRDKTCTCKEEGEFGEIAANRLELEINEYDMRTNRRLKRSKRELSAKISGGFENLI